MSSAPFDIKKISNREIQTLLYIYFIQSPSCPRNGTYLSTPSHTLSFISICAPWEVRTQYLDSGGGSSGPDKFACPYSYRSSSSRAKEVGNCGWCWWGCEHCRTVCHLPPGVYAFMGGSVGETNKAINRPAAYTYCSSSTKPSGNDYWHNNKKGSTNYAMNGGENEC